MQVVNDNTTGGNFINIRHAEDEIGTYLHNLEGSSLVAVGHEVSAGDELAKIGKPKCHLHFNVRNMPKQQPGQTQGVDIPVAFNNYEACDAQNGVDCSKEENWYKVKRGIPLNNQWVRRPKQ
jgi:murein DD-endopeptidase MepM/ murein hydrolase activator NlpD